MSVLAGRSGMSKILLAALGLLLVSCGAESAPASEPTPTPSASPSPKTFDVHGDLVLMTGGGMNYENRGKTGELCWGEDGYDDIAAGAQVVIRDGDGTKVALGELQPGYLESIITCRFAFVVEDVPSNGGIYSVEVASRGEVSFTEDEARNVKLTLG